MTNRKIPVVKNLHRKILKQITEHPETFCMGDWGERCGTTHCWGGWVVHIAGKSGYKLARSQGTERTAGEIIDKNCVYLDDENSNYADFHPSASFYSSSREALIKIKEFAAIEESLERSNKKRK